MRSIWLLVAFSVVACNPDGTRCETSENCPSHYACVLDPPVAPGNGCDPPFGWIGWVPCRTYCRLECGPNGTGTCSAPESCNQRFSVESIGDNYDAVSGSNTFVCTP
jgi:hypothetical protein